MATGNLDTCKFKHLNDRPLCERYGFKVLPSKENWKVGHIMAGPNAKLTGPQQFNIKSFFDSYFGYYDATNGKQITFFLVLIYTSFSHFHQKR